MMDEYVNPFYEECVRDWKLTEYAKYANYARSLRAAGDRIFEELCSRAVSGKGMIMSKEFNWFIGVPLDEDSLPNLFAYMQRKAKEEGVLLVCCPKFSPDSTGLDVVLTDYTLRVLYD